MAIRVDLSSKTIWMPPVCACCGSRQPGYSVEATVDKQMPSTPYCADCTRHFVDHAIFHSTFAMVVFLVGIVSLCFHWKAGLAMIVAAVILEFRAFNKAITRGKAMQGPRCVAVFSSGGARLLRHDEGHYTFEFDQEDFGLAFMDVNRHWLIDPDLDLLARASGDRGSEPSDPPLPSVTVGVGEEEQLRQAVEKLEAAQGPAGRRMVLERALENIREGQLHQRLLLEASRIDVAAVLDKVDGLKTAAAKRRHLVAALDELQKDPVPDELQVQQVNWLKDALAELEKAER